MSKRPTAKEQPGNHADQSPAKTDQLLVREIATILSSYDKPQRMFLLATLQTTDLATVAEVFRLMTMKKIEALTVEWFSNKKSPRNFTAQIANEIKQMLNDNKVLGNTILGADLDDEQLLATLETIADTGRARLTNDSLTQLISSHNLAHEYVKSFFRQNERKIPRSRHDGIKQVITTLRQISHQVPDQESGWVDLNHLRDLNKQLTPALIMFRVNPADYQTMSESIIKRYFETLISDTPLPAERIILQAEQLAHR